MGKIVLATNLIVIDQILKYLAKKDLLFFLGGDFFIGFTCNKNISWGIPLNGFAFFALWILLITLLLFYAKKQNWNIYLVIVLVGAFSNMLDRLIYGCVVDYIDLVWFPIFNFADTLIVGGIMLFLLKEFTSGKNDSELPYL